MTADSLTESASENLRYTYFELGRSAGGSRIWKDPGFYACSGDFEHPICNFAAGLDLDRASASRLARVALDHKTFNVYVTPTDRPPGLQEMLAREGFHRSYRLSQLVAEPEERQAKGCLIRAATRYDRQRIALFMVDQFFTKQGAPFREKVAATTASALTLELLAMKRDEKILGAAMISFSQGMAGIYNVCVDASLRGLGIGTSILREILAVSSAKGVPATLQCDAKLEPWYLNLGFKRTGDVDVYALPNPSGFAIM